ncbi:putative mannose-1-phosphate guanyltransferase [Babesia bovis T2Bo]|uniref:mannose-1-phosphate guanylyltransferase n=1 Tax=Babesia bovis TaxID=5865 RepID=A7AUL2_BABBO|nr:putative mannose-1-phosphate guanyltransferase [Babesia bovis T2Bo]EDO06623.1 putative mannose-1-phosphate guanyltransferase [Babesia bovis T2Bo]|eukprot:XP_001610191.1 mannose-1-phosphate guanyltransferase [Babesia bovis T2Bo]
MKCVILAGGHGTRLRPLTLTVPKPMIPFCNRPIVEYQIKASKEAGVDHIILAISHEQNNMVPMIKELSERCNIRIDCSIEKESLGTAGPLKLAKNLICDPADNCKEFLVLNSDIICSYPFAEMISAHRKNNADATILVTKTTHPSDFGVIVHDETYRIHEFVEKPSQFISNQINAGIYVLNKNMLDYIPDGSVSIERYLFPTMVAMGRTYCHPLNGLWADIGKPSDYIRAQQLYLTGRPKDEEIMMLRCEGDSEDDYIKESHVMLKTQGGLLVRLRNVNNSAMKDPLEGEPADISSFSFIGANVIIRPPVIIHPTSSIGRGCVLGPNVCIGPNTVVGEGCRIVRTTILDGVRLNGHVYIEGSIIGWESQLESWARIEGLTVLGKDVKVGEGLFVRGSIVLPHKSITTSVYESGTIII